MNAQAVELPWNVLKESARRITEIPEVTRVVYDITDKPRQRLSGNNRSKYVTDIKRLKIQYFSGFGVEKFSK